MRGYIVLLFVACIAVYGNAMIRNYTVYNLAEAPQLYVDFLKEYNKHYACLLDSLIHYDAFKNSLIMINELNSDPTGATYGINNFTDFTAEELKEWTRW